MEYLDILACPNCRRKLKQIVCKLKCDGCGEVFEVKEDIPILLPTNQYPSSQDKDFEINFMTEEVKKPNYAKFDRGVYAAWKEVEYKYLFDPHLAYGKGKIILDLGCGTGLSSIIMGSYGYDVIGMDIMFEGPRQMRGILKASEKAPFLIVGDGEHAPFQDNSFDVVFVGGVFHHLPNYVPLLQECQRILKLQGKFIAVEPNLFDLPSTIKFIAGRHTGLQSLNEFPLNPLKFKKSVSKVFYQTELSYPGINHTRYIKSITVQQKVLSLLRKSFYVISPYVCNNQFFVVTGIK